MKINTSHKNILKYDTAFINPCFDTVIEAITLQKNGQKVLLVFQNQINRTDSFQITQTFPFHLFQIFKSARNSRKLKKMFLLCPHLIQPHKVISLKMGGLKAYAIFIDFFLKNQLNEKSTVIKLKTPENLSFLNLKSLQGIVFQEYKINVSRLLIELLKYFETIGGKVRANKWFEEDEISNLIECKPKPNVSFLTNIKSPSNFALAAQNKKIRFCLLENTNLLQIDYKNAKIKNATKSEIQKELEKIVSLNPESIKEIELSTFLSTKTVSSILKTINSPLPGSFPNAQMKDNYELSLEKFDIAKQTGISYPEFKILFHRYGTGIDEMIDEAYEKINEIRDSKKIWDQVEIWFQKKNEWKV